MSAPRRSAAISLFQIVVLLSGWGLAAWLGLRAYEEKPVPAPAWPEVPPKAPSRAGKIGKVFAEWQARPELEGAAIGLALLDKNADLVFESPLARTALCPASALKTVTTGAALGVLGLDFRFETALAGTAAPGAGGVLDGDLVLIGGGDPTLSQEDLFKLVDTALAAGLKKVTGEVRVDATIFPAEAMSDHWNWGDIGNAYGAGVYGVNLEHNRLSVRFAAGAKVGEPAKLLGGAPAPADTKWSNHVTTGPEGSGDQVVVYSEPYGRTITLRGTVPLGESDFAVSGAIPDPPALAAEWLRARLESAGVQIGGKKDAPARAANTILAKHQSAPLPEIVDHIHRVSDNLESQALFLTIGLRRQTDPAEAIRAWWEEAGMRFVGFRYVDGSGLARANMIRPVDLAMVNLQARRSPFGPRYFESLTKYGGGSVRGKVGGMSGVLTQTGFLQTNGGEEWVFAIMANGLQPGSGFWGLKDELFAAIRRLDQ